MSAPRLPEIRGSLLVLFSVSGFALAVASSLGNQIEWLPPSVLFGLYGAVPLTYWLGIGVMVLSLLLGFRNGDNRVFAAQLLLVYIALWGAPALFERYPSVWDSYMHFFSTQTIMDTGSSLTEGVFSYSANYPGFFVLTAAYSLLGNPPVLEMLRFYPFVVSLFTFIALYLMVRTYLPSVGFRTALMLSTLGNVWVQYSFSPQSLGLAFALLVFVFLEKGGAKWMLMALAAFTYLAISHPTSMFLVMGALILREVIVRFRAFRAKNSLGEQTWPISVFIIIWVVWLITGARMYSWFLASLVYQKLLYIFYLPSAVEQTAFLRTTGNIFPISSLLRTALLGLFFLLFFLAILLLLRYQKRRTERKEVRTSIVSLVLVPLVLAPMDIFFLQGSIYDRALLFFALASPIFFVPALIVQRKRIFKVLLLLAVVLSAVCICTSMYQESLYVVSDRSLATSDFLSDAMPPHSTVVGGSFPDLVWRAGNWTTFVRVEYYSVYDLPFGNLTRDQGATAMVFDRTTELWHTQWGTINLYNFYLNQVGNYSKVLDNGAYVIIYGGAAAT